MNTSTSGGEAASPSVEGSKHGESSQGRFRLKRPWRSVSAEWASGVPLDDSADEIKSPPTRVSNRSFKDYKSYTSHASYLKSPTPNKDALSTSYNSESLHHSTPNSKLASSYFAYVHRKRSRNDGSCNSSFSMENDSFGSNNSSTSSKATKRASRSYESFPEEIPCYKGYQLLGDSQLVRFSEQLLNMRGFVTYTDDGRRRLGYCVSGQKIDELERRLKMQKEPLASKVIMLIGTNDFVYKTEFTAMYRSYSSIINILKKRAEKIVLLTVPPIPKLTPKHLTAVQQFNEFIATFADPDKVFIVDIASIFISYSNTISSQYFEHTIKGKGGIRNDFVHLNTMGFKLVKALIDASYFND